MEHQRDALKRQFNDYTKEIEAAFAGRTRRCLSDGWHRSA
jgi:hypothetical protein